METPADTDELFRPCVFASESNIIEESIIRVKSNENADSGYQISESSISTCPRKPRRRVKFYLETKYNVVRAAFASQEMWVGKNEIEASDIIWTDVCISVDRFARLGPHQRYNHFVGMNSLTRKNNLGRNLLRMKKFFRDDYSFFPDTWILPMDMSDFKSQPKKKAYIIKPDNSCQGRGIYITKDLESVKVDYEQGFVAQMYISRPFLLDGYKFDLRIYVLVTGCDPLRVYVHSEGLVRLCCTPWNPSNTFTDMTMHLTNYAINVKSTSFRENQDPSDIHDGHKRSMKLFFEYLQKIGHDSESVLSQIDDLIIKTLLSVQPSVAHVNFSCQPDDLENEQSFEILGFDVMLDADLKPWLLEVNHAPSFATESKLDEQVKMAVLKDTFNLLAMKKKNLSPKIPSRKRFEETVLLAKFRDETETNLGGFRKIYPLREKEYAKFQDKAMEIWETLTGAKNRPVIRLVESVPTVQHIVVEPVIKVGDKKKCMKIIIPRKVQPKVFYKKVPKFLPISSPSLTWWNMGSRLRSQSLI